VDTEIESPNWLKEFTKDNKVGENFLKNHKVSKRIHSDGEQNKFTRYFLSTIIHKNYNNPKPKLPITQQQIIAPHLITKMQKIIPSAFQVHRAKQGQIG